MRQGLKTLVAALAALLVAVGLAACGGGGSSSSTAGEATSQGQAGNNQGGGTATGKAKNGKASSGKAKNGSGEGKSGSGGSGSNSGGEGSSSGDETSGSGEGKSGSGGGKSGGSNGGGGGSGKSASDFTPKSHNDSGGGAKQFIVKGGDNSVQEFGTEAGGSEFDEAAAAVHNFFDARAEKNWAAACVYLASSVAESLEKLGSRSKQQKSSGCAEMLEALSGGVDKSVLKEAAQASIGSLRVEGDRAFVIYWGAEKTIYAIPVAKEDGHWKVASLAGTPLN